jgi:hypothetical protein
VRFPDLVTVERSTAPDKYGNPGKSPAAPAVSTVSGFHVTEETLLLPPSADVREGDRLLIGGRRFAAVDVDEIRSPSRRVMWQVKTEAVS